MALYVLFRPVQKQKKKLVKILKKLKIKDSIKNYISKILF